MNAIPRRGLLFALLVFLGTPLGAQGGPAVLEHHEPLECLPGRPPDEALYPLRPEEHLLCWSCVRRGDHRRAIEIIRSDAWSVPLRRTRPFAGEGVHCPVVFDEGSYPDDDPVGQDREVTVVANELIVKLHAGEDPSTYSPQFEDKPFEWLANFLKAALPEWSVASSPSEDGNEPILIRRTWSRPETLLLGVEEATSALLPAAYAPASLYFDLVETNPLLEALLPQFHGTPTDHEYGRQWGSHKVGAENAWQLLTRQDDVVVAVIDSGIYHGHPDFEGNLWTTGTTLGSETRYGKCSRGDRCGCTDEWDTDDSTGHGTLVSGIIGAQGNNGVAIAGMAWDPAILTVKILGTDNRGTALDAAKGIDWAVKEHARVINASWGGPSPNDALRDAIARACEQGVLVVTAAGNDGQDRDATPFYPASYGKNLAAPQIKTDEKEVKAEDEDDLGCLIVVGATDNDDAKVRGSAYGMETVDLGAPGTGIMSLKRYGSGVTKAAGTSVATAFVTGAIVLMEATRPDACPAQVKDCLLYDADFGTGGKKTYWPDNRRLNAARAVACIVNTPPPTQGCH